MSQLIIGIALGFIYSDVFFVKTIVKTTMKTIGRTFYKEKEFSNQCIQTDPYNVKIDIYETDELDDGEESDYCNVIN